jgi:hypothetical protein
MLVSLYASADLMIILKASWDTLEHFLQLDFFLCLRVEEQFQSVYWHWFQLALVFSFSLFLPVLDLQGPALSCWFWPSFLFCHLQHRSPIRLFHGVILPSLAHTLLSGCRAPFERRAHHHTRRELHLTLKPCTHPFHDPRRLALPEPCRLLSGPPNERPANSPLFLRVKPRLSGRYWFLSLAVQSA